MVANAYRKLWARPVGRDGCDVTQVWSLVRVFGDTKVAYTGAYALKAAYEHWREEERERQERSRRITQLILSGDEKTHFVQGVVWGNDALAVSEHLEVGRTVSVEGTPKAQTWTDPQGETHVWLEVHTHTVEFLNHGRGEQAAGADTHVEPSGEADCPF